MSSLRWEISIGSKHARFGDEYTALDVELTEETARRLRWHLDEWLSAGLEDSK